MTGDAAKPRIVVLAPAAADILARLGAEEQVVGVTNSVSEFPLAQKVGTHLSPGVEKTASLRPGLIVANNRFNPELAERMGARLFIYEPHTLDGIIESVRELASEIGRKEAGQALANELQSVLDGLTRPPRRLTVLYETRSRPLALGKHGSIIRDLLERAGLHYTYPANMGTVSMEYLLAGQPDIYIYQEGPMNRNPERPVLRAGWERLESCVWKVDEFDFARPNTGLFETVRLLNEVIVSEDFCARGRQLFPE